MMTVMIMMIALLATLACATAQSTAPSGLLCDFKRSPALGVRAAPAFSWIVPPCDNAADVAQTKYQIKVTSETAEPVWDSGMVAGNDSTYVIYGGPPLDPGTPYVWTVTTSQGANNDDAASECTSTESAPARFVTSAFKPLPGDAAKMITTTSPHTFAYFRKVIQVPSGLTSAQIFISAPLETPLLSNYKLYVNGNLVSLGPGRGEAPVFRDYPSPGTFSSAIYETLDVISFFNSTAKAAITIEAMNSKGAAALMLLQFRKSDGTVTMVGTDTTWSSFNADLHRGPGKSDGGGGSAGTGYVEHINAMFEPVGWKNINFISDSNWTNAVEVPNFNYDDLNPKMEPSMQVTDMDVKIIKKVIVPPPPPTPSPPGPPATCVEAGENHNADIGCPAGQVISAIKFASFGTPHGSCSSGFTVDTKCNSNHSMQVVSQMCIGKKSCQVDATCATFHEPLSSFCWDIVKSLAVQVSCKPSGQSQTTTRLSARDSNTTSYWADFGREFQGGLRLQVNDGKAGQKVFIGCGEAERQMNTGIASTWGWEFTWTLRDGIQLLEQHKYMECRFVLMTFYGPPPTNFTLSGWKTHYPYYPDDSSFTSSNETLNAVFELCRYTLEAASLDTYTDSNTRERRPYEADGIIAASGRLLIQRDYMWPRHSHAWVLQNPTWPVEWQQISPFLGWQDYMATGTPDLALAFNETMYERTKIGFLDSTGLLQTAKMGRHIVDWMPDGHESDETVARGEFTASDYTSVSNGFGAHGLELLSVMLAAGGKPNTTIASAASTLKANIKAQMWNGTNFCDGPCKDVNGNSRVMTNMFMLCFGMVPQANIDDAWKIVADWGIEQIGDYGAFWWQAAIANSYYTNEGIYTGPDDGSAMYNALTKCDTDSWCSGLMQDNLTTTRESWHDGTYSHEWGTGAIVGVTLGIMGVQQTSPAYKTFKVSPKLGGLEHGNITVPTISGFIHVNASPSMVKVGIPCGTAATLCIPRSSQDKGLFKTSTHELLLDGIVVAGDDSTNHLCTVQPVGCGSLNAKRQLTVRPRN